ncbi:MAG: phosphoribosylglycinamide formyltransferase [Halanaerobiales bacterium]|nr:phosphoribosylglycinamide formyltransferase [Halanaerobiales bacterium]
MFKLAVLASGRGSNLQSIIDKLHKKEQDISIEVVISNNKSRALKRALKNNIESYHIDDNNYNKEEYERKIIDIIEERQINLIILAGYMKVLSANFIDHFRDKIINIHPSLLPAFPGLDAQKQAVKYGVKISGCTVHFVNEKIDAGSIIMQAAVEVKYNDNEQSLAERILHKEHNILPEVIKLIADDKVFITNNRKVKIKEE